MLFKKLLNGEPVGDVLTIGQVRAAIGSVSLANEPDDDALRDFGFCTYDPPNVPIEEEPFTVRPEMVSDERDRRINAGVSFGGVVFQSRADDRENIAGASTAALAAMMQGAQPGDLRWHGGGTDFTWIALDNSLIPMDAQTVFAFGQATMAHKQSMIFAARALKDADPIPANYADDAFWP